jgi:voltage-gated potassium channel
MLERSLRRVGAALLLLVAVILTGGLLIWLLGEREYDLWETIYFAIITVSTVGYGELPHLNQHRGGQVVTAVLILSGVGAIAFFQSTLTALFVEGVLGKIFRRRRMQNRIAALENHLIVAGMGSTGEYVVDELVSVEEEFVVIDLDETHLDRANRHYGNKLLYVIGDATDDEILREAGVERARGLISSLTNDRDNLFVTLSARGLNPKLRIVSKVVDKTNDIKIEKAGADSTVSPNRIGGLRLVSELIRPKVTRFLDQMLRMPGKNLRFDEVVIPSDSPYCGCSLREVPIRDETNLLVVALHEPDGSYIYNPSPDQPLQSEIRLIVIGDPANTKKLRRLVAGKSK